MEVVDRTLLTGAPEEIAARAYEADRHFASHDRTRGIFLRELGIMLAANPGLKVWLNTYSDSSQELEVIFQNEPEADPVMVSRSNAGTHCQVQLNRWLPIDTKENITNAAVLVAAIAEIGTAPERGEPGHGPTSSQRQQDPGPPPHPPNGGPGPPENEVNGHGQ